MVHALQEIWRTLIPGGLLIDLRPVSVGLPLEVVSGDDVWVAGALDDSPGIPDDEAANDAIARLDLDGWYDLERSATFDLLTYWDSLDEMEKYATENWKGNVILPANVIRKAAYLMRQAAKGERIRARMRMILGRYRKAPSPHVVDDY